MEVLRIMAWMVTRWIQDKSLNFLRKEIGMTPQKYNSQKGGVHPLFLFRHIPTDKFKATSKNVIPAKAGIQKLLTSLDSRLCGSDKLIIIRGSLNSYINLLDYCHYYKDNRK